MGLFWGEKEGAVKGTRLEQMKAVEKWALECFQESKEDNPNLDKILENLRKINLQVRKIWSNQGREQRRLKKGKPIGIPSKKDRGMSSAAAYGVESTEEVRWIERKLTEMRAAAVTLVRDIKKEKKLSLGSKRTIRLMSSWAAEIVEARVRWDKSYHSSHDY